MEPTTAALPTQIAPQENEQSAAIKSSYEQIDRITYLASLVSRFEDIDTMMDTLRSVTATWDKSAPLTQESLTQLEHLERDLKNYLITKDTVRAFTAESLEEQLRDHGKGGVLKQGFMSLLWVVALSAVAACIPYVLPSSLISGEARLLLAIPLFFVALHTGISWLFLSALKNFQQEVRKAFQIICVGVILFSLTFSHYAAISAFQLDKYPAFQDTGIAWLVVLPYAFIFFGLRKYAQQVEVKSRILSLRFVFIVLAIVTVVAILENHFRPNFNGLGNYLNAFLNIGGRYVDPFTLMGAILAWKIHKVVATAYARPMKWLFIYLIIAFGASVLTSVFFFTGLFGGEAASSDSSNSMPFYLFMALAGIPSQLLLLWTGFSFKKELSK